MEAITLNLKLPDVPDLDKVQQRILDCQDDYICVIAGPATGKTTLVHAKVAHLLQQGVSPIGILPITFTKVGSRVMNKRFGEIVKAFTEHSHAFRYSKSLRERFLKTLCFDDLLEERQEDEEVYDWSIMDEGQDATHRQYNRYESLARKKMLVGDPWQALYTYADADPGLLDKFCEIHGIEPFHMVTNYRSAKSIVDVGNAFSKRKPEIEWGGKNGQGLVKVTWDTPPDLDNITILTRTGREVKAQVDFCRTFGIPHTWIQTSSGTKRETVNWKDGKEWIVEKPKDYLSTIICTIHAFKGEESPRVWLIYEPPKFFGTKLDIPLEARIFYVGLTRAMSELYIYPSYYPFIRRLE